MVRGTRETSSSHTAITLGVVFGLIVGYMLCSGTMNPLQVINKFIAQLPPEIQQVVNRIIGLFRRIIPG